jgi:hypothetical protein
MVERELSWYQPTTPSPVPALATSPRTGDTAYIAEPGPAAI